MSSALPIHPLVRSARVHVLANASLPVARRALSASTRTRYAERNSSSGQKQGMQAASSSQTSTSTSATSSTSPLDLSAASRAYAATSRRGQASTSLDNNGAPKRSAKGKAAAEKGQSSQKTSSTPVEGSAQNMLDSTTAPSKASTKEAPQSGENARTAERASSKVETSTPSSGNANANETTITDGIVIPATSAQNTSQNRLFSNHFSGASSQSTAQDDGARSGEIRKEVNADDRRNGNPPADASSDANASNDGIRRHLILYPFNTHEFIKRLQQADFVSRRLGTSKAERAEDATTSETSLTANKRHDPAEAIMEAVQTLLVSRGKHVVDSNVNKTEVENQAYLFTAALAELRTELQVLARNDAAALRSMVTLLQREVDSLNQRMREDVASMKHDIQVDMNNRKGEAKEEQNALEQEIQDLNNRFTISISDLKSEVEQGYKWEATRRALTIFFGSIVIVVASLAAADYYTREEIGEPVTKAGPKETEAAKPKSAEELGLVANYDEEHSSRYV